MTYGEYMQLSPSDRGLLLMRKKLSSILLAYRALCNSQTRPFEDIFTLTKFESALIEIERRMTAVTWDYCQYLEQQLDRGMSTDEYTKRIHTIDRKWQPIINEINERIGACQTARGFTFQVGGATEPTVSKTNPMSL
jgi:hypothetical protein